tara:strand:+ start:1207 stop:2214 length:1008 start_codon:yes stop_codon:yes gene_type:complete
MAKPTIIDISKATGFSKSTISKALNDSKEISRKTKEKIKNYARKINYKPNFYASHMRKKLIKNVAVIIPDILNFYFAKVLKGAQQEFFNKGYDMMCFFNDESASKEKKILDKLKNGSVAGLMISQAKNPFSENITKKLKQLQDYDIPILMFDRIVNDFKCDKVFIDDFQTTYDCVKHLVSRGKRKISLVSPIHDTLIGEKRFEGYKNALKSENIEFNPELYIPLTSGDTIQSEITKLALSKKIDAIICIEQHTTVAIQSILLNIGFKIPKEIAILGFTDGPLFKYTKPSITSVDQHGEYVGKLSAKIIIGRIERNNSDDYLEEKVPTSLNIRKST